MGEYTSCGVNFESVEGMIKYIVNDFPNISGVYVCSIRNKQQQNAFIHFADNVKEKCSFVFEEASKFCNPKKIPEEISNLIHYGRHYANTLVFTARRAVELHRDITSQSTAIISFQQTEPNDISVLKQVFSQAKELPELRYNPLNPAENEYMILGNTSILE